MTERVEEILSLIRSKNRCLDRLMKVTQDILMISDEKLIEKEGKANTSPLEIYDRERVAITRSIELFDGKLAELIPHLSDEEKKGRLVEDLKMEMHKNEILITAIFSADDIVFKKIAEVQKKIAVKLSENRKSREMLSKFRSQWINEAGEEVDTTL